MGYKTKYTMRVVLPDFKMWEVEDVEETSEDTSSSFQSIAERMIEIDDFFLWLGNGEPYKWRSVESSMLQLSTDFPDVMFWLDGEGSEQGDTWRSWYKNGKSECIRPELVWPEFNLPK